MVWKQSKMKQRAKALARKHGPNANEQVIWSKIYGNYRRPNRRDKNNFKYTTRSLRCLSHWVSKLMNVNKIDFNDIRSTLAFKCRTIEHQIIALRNETQLTYDEYWQRYYFTQQFLTCLQRHHGTVYEGILFGSTINGLGFHDSDVDLRLRPLQKVDSKTYEPTCLDPDMIDRILTDIAFATTKCCPAIGDFVPSSRCPVAKLTFVSHQDLNNIKEGLKYDVSISSSNSLGSFNSTFLRFLCCLEPRFHLLATVLRYWSGAHNLVLPGLLSSYALINMLIYFCQNTQPPLLPTVNQMRDTYLKHYQPEAESKGKGNNGLLQLEWNCMLCMNKNFYEKSSNNEPLSILLLKFFEFYLNFPYSTHILTTRTGKALTHEEFQESSQYHPRFPIKNFLNIQDPFDFKHNLTSGMDGPHFRFFIQTISDSYEKFYEELMNNFHIPPYSITAISFYADKDRQSVPKQEANPRLKDGRDWGINRLFVKLTERVD